ncbi:MAG TPA: hypothetical protein CFH84_07300 [Sulfurimonas sp. UBA12504]|nr:MAG: hypothetical protein A2019_06750 [Sulfurimonas sp. GWF2_37_8]DAB29846.1 MAG TPA: hypothetical protein CFH84_07300 [Sulfurimonas sp. UBA12504]
MNLYGVLAVGIILSIIFHFIGVYAKARNIVWTMIALMWAASIGFALNEISPKGYVYISKIQGRYGDVDMQIEKAMPQITLYEMLSIKKNYDRHEPTSH